MERTNHALIIIAVSESKYNHTTGYDIGIIRYRVWLELISAVISND